MQLYRPDLHRERTAAFNRNLESEEVGINMDINEIKNFLNENAESEDVKKFIDSLADKRVGQALETYKRGAEAEKIATLKAEIDKLQFVNKQTELKQLVLNKGVPAEFIDYVIRDTEEETAAAAGAFMENLNKTIESREPVNKGSGSSKYAGTVPGGKRYSDMKPEEIYKNLPGN